MAASSVTSEAVLFFQGGKVSKSMLFSDFEAILDGMVGVPEFAQQTMRCAYCLVNGRLQVTAVVLFTIDFDAAGMADTTWNIPLPHLAEHAAKGPDMGAGPIRLACRSQCPVAWHQDQLWDPEMKPGNNDFVAIRDVVLERGARLGLELDDGAAAEAVTAPVAVADPGQKARDDQERQRLARLIKELRLRIHTLESSQQEQIAQLRYQAQQKEDMLNAQLEKLLSQYRALKSQNAALREQSESLKSQLVSLSQNLEEQNREYADRGDEMQSLREQFRLSLEQRVEEERAILSERLHAMEIDILNKDDALDKLNDALETLRKQHLEVSETGPQQTLQAMQEKGLSFIAYHPGAGHFSVPLDKVASYMDNPVAFAANKCLVTEEHYRAWLEHYRNPVCKTPVGADAAPCGKRVGRVEAPSEFVPGESDRNSNRCVNCHSDSAIDRVLSFR